MLTEATTVLAFLLTPGLVSADPAAVHDPARLKLSADITLLHGELGMSVPMSMTVAAHQRNSSTGIIPVQADETRLALDLDGVHFEIVANETYASPPRDFVSIVKGLLTQEGIRNARVTEISSKKLLEVGVTPRVPVPSETVMIDTLIYRVYIAQRNSTVKIISFYLDPTGLGNVSQWMEMSKRIASTVRLGTGPVNRNSSGTVSLGPSFYALAISIPDSWLLAGSRGDGLHYKLYDIMPLGVASAHCDIQVESARVATIAPDRDELPAGSTIHDDILGIPIEWAIRSDKEGASMDTSVLLPSSQLQLNVFCSATSQDELQSLRKVVDTIRRSGPSARQTTPASPPVPRGP
jgi:hypothetical protein